MTVRLALAILLMLVVAGMGLSSGERGIFTGDYASFNAGPSGTRGLFEIAAELGKDPVRLTSDFEMLPLNGAVVSVSPKPQKPQDSHHRSEGTLFFDYEMNALQSWVSEGNSLLVFHPSPESLLSRFGLRLASPVSKGKKNLKEGWPPATESASVALEALSWLEGVSTLEIEAGIAGVELAPITMDAANANEGGAARQLQGFAPLLITSDGRVVAAEVAYGSGRFVWVGSPFLASNEGVLRADNGLFLGRLLDREAKIHVDEFHHGFIYSRSLTGYLKASGLWLVGCQLLFVALCFWWRVGGGFGRHRPESASRERSESGYLRAMSLIYLRGRHHHHALEVLMREFERALIAIKGLPSATPRSDLAGVLREAGHLEDARKVERFVGNLEAGGLNPSKSVSLAMEITGETRALNQEGPRRRGLG